MRLYRTRPRHSSRWKRLGRPSRRRPATSTGPATPPLQSRRFRRRHFLPKPCERRARHRRRRPEPGPHADHRRTPCRQPPPTDRREKTANPPDRSTAHGTDRTNPPPRSEQWCRRTQKPRPNQAHETKQRHGFRDRTERILAPGRRSVSKRPTLFGSGPQENGDTVRNLVRKLPQNPFAGITGRLQAAKIRILNVNTRNTLQVAGKPTAGVIDGNQRKLTVQPQVRPRRFGRLPNTDQLRTSRNLDVQPPARIARLAFRRDAIQQKIPQHHAGSVFDHPDRNRLKLRRHQRAVGGTTHQRLKPAC
jgi:hypothetical protein